MKISKAIKLLQKLKREIGGDPQVRIGDDRQLKEDDIRVSVLQAKSGKCSYGVHLGDLK